MQSLLRAFPLDEMDEEQFLSYLDKDRILHVFLIYDLKHNREKTEVWVATRNGQISGYLLEFSKRIVHTHGDVESVAKLLGFVDVDEPVFAIKPHHLTAVNEVFEPVAPTDPSSQDKLTTYFVMKMDSDNFHPMIRHHVKRLGDEDLGEVLQRFGDEYEKRVENAIHGGLAFGAYKDGSIASLATVTEILEDLALIRGVYTAPPLRGRGLATSACSALVAELIRLGKTPMLWVAKDNLPARKVYERMGFRKTEHVLLGFKARRP